MKRFGKRLLSVLICISSLFFLLSGCGEEVRSAESPSEAEPDPHEGMVLVNTGLDEPEWVRLYEDLPRNPLTAGQFVLDHSRLRYTGVEYNTMCGIDVSAFQGEIDWQAVADDGVEFAMIRSGYRGYSVGSIQADETFEQNVLGAAENGIKVGVYFFSQAVTPEEALEEADFVLEQLRALPEGSVTMPVAFDWETIGVENARTDDVEDDVLNACALAFCRRIAEAGYTPMIYSSRYMAYHRYDLSALSDYGLWVVMVGGDPGFYYEYAMWQYTGYGRVSGIPTDVDLDIFFRPRA